MVIKCPECESPTMTVHENASWDEYEYMMIDDDTDDDISSRDVDLFGRHKIPKATFLCCDACEVSVLENISYEYRK